MGAQTFAVTAAGKTAQEAFDKAVDDARYEYGHGGYSGTIAEKSSFVMIGVPYQLSAANPNASMPQLADEYAEKLMNVDDSRITDKWGPAGCIDLLNGEYLFFGYASS